MRHSPSLRNYGTRWHGGTEGAYPVRSPFAGRPAEHAAHYLTTFFFFDGGSGVASGAAAFAFFLAAGGGAAAARSSSAGRFPFLRGGASGCAAGGAPLAIASGVSVDNIAEFVAGGACCFIVASSVACGFHKFDEGKLTALMEKARSLALGEVDC